MTQTERMLSRFKVWHKMRFKSSVDIVVDGNAYDIKTSAVKKYTDLDLLAAYCSGICWHCDDILPLVKQIKEKRDGEV